MTQETNWLTRREIALHLKIHVNTVDRWREELGMPFAQVEGSVRFDRLAVDEWLRNKPKETVQ